MLQRAPLFTPGPDRWLRDYHAQLCCAVVIWPVPNPYRRRIWLAACGVFAGNRNPKPRLGDWSAHLFGALAEKIGDRKAIVVGGLVYVAGLMLSAQSATPEAHQAYAWLNRVWCGRDRLRGHFGRRWPGSIRRQPINGTGHCHSLRAAWGKSSGRRGQNGC